MNQPPRYSYVPRWDAKPGWQDDGHETGGLRYDIEDGKRSVDFLAYRTIATCPSVEIAVLLVTALNYYDTATT